MDKAGSGAGSADARPASPRRSDLRDAVDLRLTRILTRHLVGPVRWVLLAGQAIALLLCVVVATGWRGPSEPGLDGVTYQPWQAVLTIVALGSVSTAVSIASGRSTGWRRGCLVTAGLVVTLLAVAALPSDGWGRGVAVLGTGCAAAALLLPAGDVGRELTRCLLALVPAMGAVTAIVTGSRVDRALQALRADQFAVSAALGLSLLAIFSAATAVEEHRERTQTLLTWRIGRAAVVVAACLKLALLTSLYLHLLGDFFGGQQFWQPRLDQPLSWIHAALLALIVVTVALTSRTRPVAGRGFTPRLLMVTLLLGLGHVAILTTFVVVTALGVVRPHADRQVFGPAGWLLERIYVVQLAGVLLLLAVAVWDLRGRRRLTTGVYLWLAAGVWLGPALAGVAFADPDGPTAWAAPGQVDMVMTLTVLLVMLLPGGRRISSRALMTLILVPVVVLHLGMVWPSDWATAVLPLAVIASVVATLWLNPPPVYADRRRNEQVRALLVARTVMILVLYLYFLEDPALGGQLDAAITVAWLWLGVPLTAVLTAHVAAGPSAGTVAGRT